MARAARPADDRWMRQKGHDVKGYGPAEQLGAESSAGPATFLRLPRHSNLDGVDVAFVGLPFDPSLTGPAGARFGPQGIREASLALRPHYNPSQRIQVFDRVSVVDFGDSPVRLGFLEQSLPMMEATVANVLQGEAVPIVLGGERYVTLAGLRAAAERHGALALVSFDAHGGLWEQDGHSQPHATLVRRAVDEGLVDPQRSTLVGMRGGLRHAREYDEARETGFTVVPWEDLAQLGSGMLAAAADIAAGKAYLSFDMDFVDPAYAPGVLTLEVGGPSSAQALALLRACRGLDVAAADVVGVVPDRDSAGLTTALGATIAYEILTLIACERRTEA
jgi:agmatinase